MAHSPRSRGRAPDVVPVVTQLWADRMAASGTSYTQNPSTVPGVLHPQHAAEASAFAQFGTELPDHGHRRASRAALAAAAVLALRRLP